MSVETREAGAAPAPAEEAAQAPPAAPGNSPVDSGTTQAPPSTGDSPGYPTAPPDSDTPVTRSGLVAVFRTTVVCAVAGAAGHLVLLAGWMFRDPAAPGNLLPWQPVVGASLSVVAVVAFGGFYHASLRARVAIMSSFLLTFLLLLTYMLTVRELAGGGGSTMVIGLVDDFRVIVQTIVGFYFGTETVLSVTKIIRAPRDNAAAIRRADRDLPAG